MKPFLSYNRTISYVKIQSLSSDVFIKQKNTGQEATSSSPVFFIRKLT